LLRGRKDKSGEIRLRLVDHRIVCPPREIEVIADVDSIFVPFQSEWFGRRQYVGVAEKKIETIPAPVETLTPATRGYRAAKQSARVYVCIGAAVHPFLSATGDSQ